MPKPPRRFMPVMLPVTIRFDKTANPPFTFEGMDDKNQLTVKSGMATIVLQLQPADGQKLVYHEMPITWGGGAEPACMSVRRESDTQVTIVNYNTNMGTEDLRFDFEVSVWSDGIGYMSQDPTILNAEVPPTTPDCDEDEDEGRHVKRGSALRAV
jgi:hypothetical protein